MDWKSCIKGSWAKAVKPDRNLIASLIKSAEKKIVAERQLPDSLSEPKVSLAYDALRAILEALASDRGFKVYNHEGYTAFLKEVLGEQPLGDLFDGYRKLRNAINYYGKEISEKEAKSVIKGILGLAKMLKGKIRADCSSLRKRL